MREIEFTAGVELEVAHCLLFSTFEIPTSACIYFLENKTDAQIFQLLPNKMFFFINTFNILPEMFLNTQSLPLPANKTAAIL